MSTHRIKIAIACAALALVTGFSSCDTSNGFDPANTDYFIKYYGGDGNQTAVDLVANSDGSIVMVGKSEFNLDKRIYFVKVDPRGDIITETYFGGPSDEVKDIEPLPNGEFMIVSDNTVGTNNIDINLLRVSADGTVLDSKIYGTRGNDISKSLTVLSDGGILVSGTTDSTATWAVEDPAIPDLGDFMVHRFTSDLEIDNTWDFDAGFGGNLDCVTKTSRGEDGFFYALGYSNANVAGINNGKKLVFFYFRIRPDGQGLENNTPEGSVNIDNTEVTAATAVSTISPGYVGTGKSVNSSGTNQLFIFKLKKTLTFIENNDIEIFTKTAPENTQLSGVSVAPAFATTQGYLIVANDKQLSSTSGNELNNIWLSKVDLSGKVNWSAKFGSETGNDTAAAVTELPDGKVLVLGTIELGDQQKKLALIKLSPKGQLQK